MKPHVKCEVSYQLQVLEGIEDENDENSDSRHHHPDKSPGRMNLMQKIDKALLNHQQI